MTITYRDATPGDAATLDRIFGTTFCDSFGHLYRKQDLDAFLASFGAGDWDVQLADSAYAVRIAEVDGAPSGYVKLGPMKLPFETTQPSILLDQLYVLKDLSLIHI